MHACDCFKPRLGLADLKSENRAMSTHISKANVVIRRFTIVIALLSCIVLAGCGASRATSTRAEADARYKLVTDTIGSLVTGGRITRLNWSDDGQSLTYRRGDDTFRFDFQAKAAVKIDADEAVEGASTTRPERRSNPARGRQRDRATSPDGKWIAVCKDWNVVIEPKHSDGDERGEPIRVTADGQRKFRYGTASWVYGEELDQRDAMWWSADSRKLVFYEFDERQVPDHYLTGGLTELHTKLLIEGYPKPGEPNPIANLLVYDLESRKIARIEMPQDGEWYTYAVQFSPAPTNTLIFNRTNRRQNILHVMAADLETGQTRIVLTETQETWQENAPEMKFLKDGHRFIWASEKTGWKQFELRDLDGSLINTLTTGDYETRQIEHIDETNGVVYYTAFSDRNPLNAHLHRVNLDGSDQRRLTQETLNHSVRISPDAKWFVTEYESAVMPPFTALYDTQGNRIATLAESDASKFRQMKLQKPEMFAFRADDGQVLYGVLHRPSNFKRSKKYPLVIDVYGGPMSQSVRSRFVPAVAACEYGFLIAEIDNRGTANRGKAFSGAAYMKLGEIDIKDQADAARFLASRPYVDGQRVGIYGHSYGGYMSALAILKYPDVFHAAVAGGTVSDWRNYDSIYTERFMRTPQENETGYDAGSCIKYADRLKGKLLLLHGMVDDNVHPNNAWQLVDALHKANKSFEMMFYPNAGHSIGGNAADLRWNFLRRHLLDQ
jgi:dipeptidyl-peptidase 4